MIKVWWLGSSTGYGNLGDVLTPYILNFFDIPYTFVKKHYEADMLFIGSIARRANSKTTVVGSGIIDSGDRLNPEAKWNLVRGPLTRDRIIKLGGTCLESYGDPALITPLLCNESKKEHDIGFIPHHINYSQVKESLNDEFVVQLRHLHRSPLDTVKEITKCRKVISSSLHGIIIAHAYGIPAAWVESENKLKGDDVKFQDYFQSVGLYNVKKTSADSPIFTLPKIDLTTNIENSFKEINL